MHHNEDCSREVNTKQREERVTHQGTAPCVAPFFFIFFFHLYLLFPILESRAEKHENISQHRTLPGQGVEN